jgi:hypothetical protein
MYILVYDLCTKYLFLRSSLFDIYIQNKKQQMITIQEILGTDSIAASRLTINSNFLLVENEINDLENVFNINVVTGAMDISQATSGQLKAKTFYANQAAFPASGTPTVNIYGTGASAGNASFSGSLSASQLTLSATGTFNQVNASGPAVFGSTVRLDGAVTFNSTVTNGPTGTYIEKNATGASGSTNAFISPLSGGGGGITGTFSNPYALGLSESVVYVDAGYVSSASGDAGFTTGFYFYVATGTAPSGTPPSIPQGFRLTLINTNSAGGRIATGVTGPTGSTYYTGFNTLANGGAWASKALSVPSSMPYKTSITLQWENRVGKGGTSQNGSWVVISSAGYAASDFYPGTGA